MPGRHRTRGSSAAIAEFEPLAPAGRLSKLAFVLIAVLLFFEAFAHGAVEAWSELAALGLSGLLVVVLLLRHVVDRESRPPATWLWFPLGLFAAFAALQAMPLPAAWSEWLAPGTLSRKQDLLGSGDLTMSTISYYPRETWRLLRMTFVGGALFAAACTLGRDRGGVTRLLMMVFVVGAGEAIMSLAQIISQSDWTYAAIGREARRAVTAGSFLNYSNFSQFVNMSIGAGLGLLLVRSEHRRRVTGRTPSWDEFWRSEGWIVAGLSFCCLSVFTSMSRNGVLSMAVAGAVLLIMLQWRRSSSVQAWALVSVPLAVFVGLCVVGFDAVYDRLGTLSQEGILTDRWQLTLDTIHAWHDHPVFGIGLNAHEYAFPAYDTTGSLAIAQTADNDYVQILEETGLIGVTLIATVLAMVTGQIVRLTGSHGPSTSLAAHGIVFGLVAVAVHSWTDFGQRIPAVFSLTSLMVGVVVAAGHRERRHRQASKDELAAQDPTWLPPTQRRLRGGAAAVVLLPIWASALVVAFRAAQAEESWAKAYQLEVPLYERNWQGSVEEYRLLLQHAGSAAALEPNNVRYAFRLNLYRWQAMLMAGAEVDQSVTMSPEFQAVTGSLVDALAQNRQLCPTFGLPYALEGQLRYSVLGDLAEGRRQILVAAELAPNDPAALLNVGRLHAAEGDLKAASQAFGRLVSLQGSYFRQAAEQLVKTLKAPDEAERLCGDSPERLEVLAKLYLDLGDPIASRAPELRLQASRLLEKRVESKDATPQELARLAQLAHADGDHQRSVSLYRRALSLQYNNVPLRLELAATLRDAGLLSDAMEEIRVCLRLKPQHAAAGRLESQLYDLLHQDGSSDQ
ncbi:O-Antigen ligase [Posidoniimonas polymericola]|uniref:O-Antigen ligase n=1 Tax=Posidoniimonas polymericola TaxID=2528002 RepID=A0A5C5YTI4_9BACT|nr:O-antigen ligase family protein [Posidoniimonas polymericola]TWT78299.1 O-Antigen ligase [Posidoniimonas polymericola]